MERDLREIEQLYGGRIAGFAYSRFLELGGEKLEHLLLDFHVAPQPHGPGAGGGEPAPLALDRGQLLSHATHVLAVLRERLAEDLELHLERDLLGHQPRANVRIAAVG